ncbi:MAG: hypothetical protein K6T61_13175, partial [Bryobacteraceae bacterium]|nr:hypothetical protein [Bryobacteraceae bacterium]
MSEPGFSSSSRWRQFLTPSLADILVISIAARLFLIGDGWTGLLADGDTGWHIRTGQWILEHGQVPDRDLFSFTRAGEAWYAWEWLSDVGLALVHDHWGLSGIAVLSGGLVGLSAAALFRSMLKLGVHPFLAVAAMFPTVMASSIHYLARPHLFTILLMAVSCGILIGDRRSRSPRVWILPPLAALWANLHAGFLSLLATLALLSAGLALEGWLDPTRRAERWPQARRYGLLLAASAAATLVNPYGWSLHGHIGRYLTSDWIRNTIQEFQSPSFRSENMLHFELLLVAGLITSGVLLARKEIANALLMVAWAHMALSSVRHIPLFAIVTVPLAAEAASRWWEQAAARRTERSSSRILWALGSDLAPSFRQHTAWAALLGAVLIWLTPASKWPRDFPSGLFPTELVRLESSRLKAGRVFTSDQWADYLIYYHWPEQKVFFDGRSDFYGPSIGNDYLKVITGRRQWEEILLKYDIDLALAPAAWPLVSLLEQHPGWTKVREDKVGVLFERRDS